MTNKKIKKIPTLNQLALDDGAFQKLFNLFTEEEQIELKDELSLLPKVLVKHKVEVNEES